MTTTTTTMKRGATEAETCRLNGWTVGTRLVGDEGYGPTVIRITGIGERSLLAVAESHRGEPVEHEHERLWTLTCRDWTEYRPLRLDIGDRLYGYPCAVRITSMLWPGATGWCETCRREHHIDRRMYERGRGPWRAEPWPEYPRRDR